MGEVSDVRDGTHDSPKYQSIGHPFVTSKNVKNGYITYDDIQYISDEDFAEINKRSKVDINDILMGMIGTIGNMALIRTEPDFAIKNVALIKDTKQINYLYLYHLLQSPFIEKQLTSGMDGGTQKFVSLGNVRNLNVIYPSDIEQDKIGCYFEKLDHLITLHQRKLFLNFAKRNDWEQRKLGEICQRVIRKNKNNESDLPLTIASQYGLIDQRDFFNKVVAAKDMSNYYLLRKGEFAYNKSYSNGFEYGSIKRLNAYEQGCLSTLYICFEITSDEVDSDYLECFFDTLKWYGDLSMICAEGARNHGLLNVDIKAFFADINVSTPTNLKEQRKIATYLNNLDHLITLHQRKCDETKKLKKFMLQKMFPKKDAKKPEIRFAGFTDDWEQRKLGEILIGLQNNTLSRADLSNETGVAKNVHYGDVLIKFGEVLDVSKEKLPMISDESILSKYKSSFLQNGDVIVADTAEDSTVGKCSEIAGLNDEIVLSGLHTIPYRPIEKFASGYLGYYLNSSAYHNQLIPLMQGIKVTAISKSAMQDTDIVYPKSMEEQGKIGDYFQLLDNLITLHQRKCDKLKKFKKYMLQNMFPQKG